MSKECPHVGVNHPVMFQCGDCDDDAMHCNCNVCGMVFCEECQKMIFVDCDTIREKWEENHPDLDIDVEAVKIHFKKSREASA